MKNQTIINRNKIILNLLTFVFSVLFFKPVFAQNPEILIKPYNYSYKKINNSTIIRIISNESDTIKIDTFRKEDSYWIFFDSSKNKIEFGRRFKRYLIWDMINGVKIKNISYVKNGNWFYINFNTFPIKFKRKRYTRLKRHAMSDMYLF